MQLGKSICKNERSHPPNIKARGCKGEQKVNGYDGAKWCKISSINRNAKVVFLLQWSGRPNNVDLMDRQGSAKFMLAGKAASINRSAQVVSCFNVANARTTQTIWIVRDALSSCSLGK